MPLYVYRCECGREFEELCTLEESKSPKTCPDCGKMADKTEVTSFGISTTIDSRSTTVYSPKEIDKVVGAAADKRWQGYNEAWSGVYAKRRAERLKGKDVKEVVINPDKNGGVAPFEHLGDSKEQSFRREYAKEYKEQVVDKKKDSDTPVVMKIPD